MMEDQDGEPLADGCYLYRPSRFWEPFWVLFEKLGQLNDYCFNQLVASEGKLRELQCQQKIADEDDTAGAEASAYYSEAVPGWEENVATFTKAVPLVLLASFAEWGLKHIAIHLCGCIPKKTDRSKSDVEFLLFYLVSAGIAVSEPEKLLIPIRSFREVRNNFAHGKWALLADELRDINLRDAFVGVSSLFETIEEAAWRSAYGALRP
ncbi:MAG: hypothetical protein WA777_00740 [Rhodanobacter sp.]